MHLNDILEENSLKAISTKTKISEENLEYLIASEFDALTKVKTLGFISILEREYKADLGAITAQAEEHYGQSVEEHLFPIGQPIIDEHKSKPKLLILFIFVLFAVSSWYFLTQFDKKNLNNLIPFIDEETIENFIGSDTIKAEENSSSEHLKISDNTKKKDVAPELSKRKNPEDVNASDSVNENNTTVNETTSSAEDNSVEDTEA